MPRSGRPSQGHHGLGESDWPACQIGLGAGGCVSRGRRTNVDLSHDREHRLIGLHVQLFPQQRSVNFRLPERTGAVADSDQRPHETGDNLRAVRVKRRQPPPPLHGAPMLATLRGADGETLQRIGDEPGQPGALCIDPVFELGRSVRMVEVNAVEERADVQRDGALELRAGERGLQIRDVAIDKGRVEAQVGGAEEEVVGAQLATQGGQRLRQRMPGVLRVALGPEEGEQAVAADTPLSPRREHGEQRQLAALRRRPGDRTALTGEREPAEGP